MRREVTTSQSERASHDPRLDATLSVAMEFEALYDSRAERLLVYFTRRTLDPETALDL